LRLGELLDELPAGFQCREGVLVGTVGGFASAALRQRSLRAFGAGLVSRYGSNETGPICEDLDPSGTGVMAPGVDVRIVDGEGRDLPAGETGIIAVRTPSMALGYVDAPPADQAAFRDGWFYSGDLGVLVGPRVLRLAGRHDDLLNLGGIKVPAVRVEDKIRELVRVRDCAVLAINPQQTGATVAIAMVLEAGMPRELAIEKLEAGLELGAGTLARVAIVDALPRTAAGKLDRIALHRLF
jgi:acyl-CoA synthetase (AMP-forming)/AMP-acid ligase II